VSEFCSEATRAAGQSIVGTAPTETSAWVVIEHDGAWAAKAFENAAFGFDVRRHVDGWVAAIPGVRPQLIRRPGRSSRDGLTLYLGVSDPGAQQLREFSLSDEDGLLNLDAPAIIASMRAGEDPGVGTAVATKVILVCTHGKRDRCCAKWGTPVYERVSARNDVVAWQTTHLGGHRFAATMLCLPDGIAYGWLEPDDVEGIIDAHLRGGVDRLDRLRGRTALTSAEQAAEHFVREHAGAMGLDAVRVDEVVAGALGTYHAKARAGDVRYDVRFTRVVSLRVAPPSCGKDPEPVVRYELGRVAPE
jgi:hypothetical protein